MMGCSAMVGVGVRVGHAYGGAGLLGWGGCDRRSWVGSWEGMWGACSEVFCGLFEYTKMIMLWHFMTSELNSFLL